MLRHFGVQPVLVFDGGGLPMKSDQEIKRARYVAQVTLNLGVPFLLTVEGVAPCDW